MFDLLSRFIAELRRVGLPVSLSEHVDAASAMEVISIGERETFKSVLAATLVKDSTYRDAFDTAFEVYFAGRQEGDLDLGPGSDSGTTAAGPERSEKEWSEDLVDALAEENEPALRDAARGAVERYAGFERGRPVGGAYYRYRTLRHLDLDAVTERLSALDLIGPTDNELVEKLNRDEAERRVSHFEDLVDQAILERLVEDRGAEAVADSTRETLPEDVDVMHATRDELADLERALAPLSRKLASRLARRRRRRRRGPLDMRHTVRASLSTGGVPLDIKFRPPRPAKPDLVVLADISGSVASFARFTLHLVHAISEEFSKVRSFVFVDGVDEVTRFFAETDDPGVAAQRIATEADVVAFDGHSDYGRALERFVEMLGADVTRRTTVLILGDARSNYHPARPEFLADLRERVKAIYWLNPEPRGYWNSGDSVIALYEPHCEEVLECRTLRQLEEFVSSLP